MIYRGQDFLAGGSNDSALPSSGSKLDRRPPATHMYSRLRKRDKLLTGEGGGRVREEPNHTTSFNTLWMALCCVYLPFIY
jgi:hypothetical protein